MPRFTRLRRAFSGLVLTKIPAGLIRAYDLTASAARGAHLKRKPLPYRVLPLPRVQREAKSLLTSQQLVAAIRYAKRLQSYPDIPEVSISPCGIGMELRVEHSLIGRQGWLRAMFWIHERSRTIYIVDLF